MRMPPAALAAAALVAAFLLPAIAPASPAVVGAPAGYAQGTTGAGPNAPVCHAKDAPGFIACAGKGGQIVVSDVPRLYWQSPPGSANIPCRIASGTTILGPVLLVTPGTTCQIDDAQNIIVQGVTFRSSLTGVYTNPATGQVSNCPALADPSNFPMLAPWQTIGCGIPLNIIGSSKHVWVDHDTFSYCGEKCIEVFSGNVKDLDPQGRLITADDVTVSNSLFENSYFCMAISSWNYAPASMVPAAGHERVSLYDNLWRGCYRRTPRVAVTGQVHQWNDAILDWGGQNVCAGSLNTGGGYGFAESPERGGQIVMQGVYYEAWPAASGCKRAIANYGGDFASFGWLALDGAGVSRGSAPAMPFTPPYPFSTVSAAAVPQLVLHAGAGP